MSIKPKLINVSLNRDWFNNRIARLEAKVKDLESEIVIKNEQRARYDDRVLALRKALGRIRGTDAHEHAAVAANEAIAVAKNAIAADDKAAKEMPE